MKKWSKPELKVLVIKNTEAKAGPGHKRDRAYSGNNSPNYNS